MSIPSTTSTTHADPATVCGGRAQHYSREQAQTSIRSLIARGRVIGRMVAQPCPFCTAAEGRSIFHTVHVTRSDLHRQRTRSRRAA